MALYRRAKFHFFGPTLGCPVMNIRKSNLEWMNTVHKNLPDSSKKKKKFALHRVVSRPDTSAGSFLGTNFVSLIVWRQLKFRRSVSTHSTLNSCGSYRYPFGCMSLLSFRAIASQMNELPIFHSENDTKRFIWGRKFSNFKKTAIAYISLRTCAPHRADLTRTQALDLTWEHFLFSWWGCPADCRT